MSIVQGGFTPVVNIAADTPRPSANERQPPVKKTPQGEKGQEMATYARRKQPDQDDTRGLKVDVDA